MDAFGGRRGVLDSGLPPLTFVSAYLISGSNLTVALVAALVAGLVVTGWRLATHDTLRHALAGFGAVALAAFVASRTGRPQDYFLPSLLANAGAALAWAISIWVKRPFLGLTVGALTRSSAWRTDPVMLAAYCRASWIWVASFLVRVAVMTPLWLAGMTVALGLAKVALGWPMVLVVIWLSWLVVEPAHRARREALAADGAGSAGAGRPPATGLSTCPLAEQGLLPLARVSSAAARGPPRRRIGRPRQRVGGGLAQWSGTQAGRHGARRVHGQHELRIVGARPQRQHLRGHPPLGQPRGGHPLQAGPRRGDRRAHLLEHLAERVRGRRAGPRGTSPRRPASSRPTVKAARSRASMYWNGASGLPGHRTVPPRASRSTQYGNRAVGSYGPDDVGRADDQQPTGVPLLGDVLAAHLEPAVGLPRRWAGRCRPGPRGATSGACSSRPGLGRVGVDRDRRDQRVPTARAPPAHRPGT